jgi:hypothetical protein
MPPDPPRLLLMRLAARAAHWPAPLRDLGAASLALWSVCLGELLAIALPVPAEALLALPGVLVAWWALGPGSAAFAMLAAALAVAVLGGGRADRLFGAGPEEALVMLALAAALVLVCLLVRRHAAERERRAALLLDACATDAACRIAAAEARLREAEAASAAARRRLAAAEADLQRARDAGRARPAASWSRDAGLDEALRREGGV